MFTSVCRAVGPFHISELITIASLLQFSWSPTISPSPFRHLKMGRLIKFGGCRPVGPARGEFLSSRLGTFEMKPHSRKIVKIVENSSATLPPSGPHHMATAWISVSNQLLQQEARGNVVLDFSSPSKQGQTLTITSISSSRYVPSPAGVHLQATAQTAEWIMSSSVPNATSTRGCYGELLWGYQFR